MDDKRLYPRIGGQWPIYIMKSQQREQVGRVLNISLSGVCIELDDQDISISDYSTTIKLTNDTLSPAELVLNATKKWDTVEDDRIVLGLELKGIEAAKRQTLIQYLSRNEALTVECLLM